MQLRRQRRAQAADRASSPASAAAAAAARMRFERTGAVSDPVADLGQPQVHPALARAIADGVPHDARLLEVIGRAVQIVRAQRHLTERGQRVRLELTLADVAG